MIQEETALSVKEFLNADDDQQRHLFDEPNVSYPIKSQNCLEQEKSPSDNSRIL